MSDIQEEQKRLYKRAEENDYIVKDIAQYEENDSKLAKYTIMELQNRINKALRYMSNYIEVENAPINERIKIEFEEVINILKGDNK